MPGALRAISVAVLLAGPTVLAFFSGGFFDEPRLVAGFTAWLLVAVAAITSEQPLPRSRAGRVALGAFALLTLWSGLSLLWAPLSAPATDDLQRNLLYLGALTAAAALLRGPAAARATEPALAAGALVVVGYGLSGRLLPGLIELSAGVRAAGRLEQPLTYWNAMGALAAVGLVLCVRVAGDETRPAALRAAALAAAPALGAGTYLSFSRGALLAAGAGLLAMTLLARRRPQLRASLAGAGLGVLGAVACGAFAGVRALEGSPAAREREGAVALVLLLALAACGAALALAAARRERAGTLAAGSFSLPRVRTPLATALAAALVAALIAAAWAENRPGRGPAASGARTERLSSLQSDRLDYWKVAARAGAGSPIAGVGAGGFRVEWLSERNLPEPADDAHSLYLETFTELGLVGLALLGA